MANDGEMANDVGDLFLELVPPADYGNISKEKAAMESLIKSLIIGESRLVEGLDAGHRNRFNSGLSALGEQYKSIGTPGFNRKAFEAGTYDALLQIVTTVNAESLQQLRAFLETPKAKRKGYVTTAEYALPLGETNVPAPLVRVDAAEPASPAEESLQGESEFEFYKSSFKAELLYLESNPQLLALCGSANPKREEHRKAAIRLVKKILETMVDDPKQANLPAHEQFKEKLLDVRRFLYPAGVEYFNAQEWGFREQERRNKTNKKST